MIFSIDYTIGYKKNAENDISKTIFQEMVHFAQNLKRRFH